MTSIDTARRARGDTVSVFPRPDAPAATPAPAAVPAPDPHAVWAARARTAGHPVVAVLPGRLHPDPMPIWMHTMPPNDVLDAAKEYARSRVDWVHVIVPTAGAALTLSAAILGPPGTGPVRRRCTGTGLPFARLVAQQRIAPWTMSWTVAGVTTHAVDVPVSWLSHPVRPVDVPAWSPPHPAPALRAEVPGDPAEPDR